MAENNLLLLQSHSSTGNPCVACAHFQNERFSMYTTLIFDDENDCMDRKQTVTKQYIYFAKIKVQGSSRTASQSCNDQMTH